MATLRQKIGQLFLIGCQGETLSQEEQLLTEEYRFGGFILFGRNCCEPRQILSLCRSIWEANDEIPPFIAIDQEGGRVHRLPATFPHFPAAGRIGDENEPELAYQLGRASAEALALLGINLNFAPVLDVNSNPNNPIIGDRAFGSTPQQVMELSSAWMRGLRDGGIIPCGKHFPGHGESDKDSHFDLPAVHKSLDELKAIELPPFVHACRNKIESLMTAHVRYPALDPNRPATLSEPIVTGLLRHQLGYDGVVFSDDMEMKAISENYTVEEATTLAVRAGVDVILFCHALPKAVQAFESLCDETERDPTLRARVADSYRRITELKRRSLSSFVTVKQEQFYESLRLWERDRIFAKINSNS
jgi:beta-N-acetylhexosaminidase